MTAFWSMGGYARYVWPCFALTLAVLAWNVQSARRFQAMARLRAIKMSAGSQA